MVRDAFSDKNKVRGIPAALVCQSVPLWNSLFLDKKKSSEVQKNEIT